LITVKKNFSVRSSFIDSYVLSISNFKDSQSLYKGIKIFIFLNLSITKILYHKKIDDIHKKSTE